MIASYNKTFKLTAHAVNRIMLIEDNMDHAELIIRTIKELPIPRQVCHFQNGLDALDYLFPHNDFNALMDHPRPQIILLDIHLPGADGIEILRTIKASAELRAIPVIMLTTSAAERDIMYEYHNHANSYLVKPAGCEDFKELMGILCFYWLRNNVSPNN